MKESHKRTEDKKTGRKKKKRLESTFVSVSDHAGCVCVLSNFSGAFVGATWHNTHPPPTLGPFKLPQPPQKILPLYRTGYIIQENETRI